MCSLFSQVLANKQQKVWAVRVCCSILRNGPFPICIDRIFRLRQNTHWQEYGRFDSLRSRASSSTQAGNDLTSSSNTTTQIKAYVLQHWYTQVLGEKVFAIYGATWPIKLVMYVLSFHDFVSLAELSMFCCALLLLRIPKSSNIAAIQLGNWYGISEIRQQSALTRGPQSNKMP